MGLRGKIFLLVGGLFFITLIVLFSVGHFETSYNLKNAERSIAKEIEELNRERINHIETYLSLLVGGAEAKVDNLLNKVSEYPSMREKFIPNAMNYRTNTWMSSATLLAANQWIDFIQCTNEGILTSLIISSPPYLLDVYRIPIDDDLSVVIRGTKEGTLKGYIGVPYWINQEFDKTPYALHELNFAVPSDLNYWLIFTIDSIMNIEPEKLVAQNLQAKGEPLEVSPSIKDSRVYEKIIKGTIEEIKKTKEALLKHPDLINTLMSNKAEKWLVSQLSTTVPPDEDPSDCVGKLCRLSVPHLHDSIDRQIKTFSNRYDQHRMIWELSNLIASGIWNYTPFDENFAKGLVRFPVDKEQNIGKWGDGILCKDVFFSNPYPVESSCDAKLSWDEMEECLAKDLDILTNSEEPDKIFFGNSVTFVDDTDPKNVREGQLTIGVSGRDTLQRLAIASGESVLLITKNSVHVAFDKNGNEIDLEIWKKLDIAKLLKERKGILEDVSGNEYFFDHFDPQPGADMHVFVFRLHQSAFEMLRQLAVKTHELIWHISGQFGIIAVIFLLLVLITLNRIIKRTTLPIVKLADATKSISAGKLSEISLPERKDLGEDEVGLLYRSFCRMIEEMKDKKKVEGILDKVVSKEIASEILASGVNLGGELRRVTILFADVRGFTELSELLGPRELLDVLNQCLTKISDVIDRYGGVIDKYVGDEVMALFGAPIDAPHPELSSVLCAIEIRRVLDEWNDEREKNGLIVLKVGIGIATGQVLAGNLGAENRLNYTVLGLTVNLANRLCSFAKEQKIMIDKKTLEGEGVEEQINFKQLPPEKLKGISEPVEIYQIIGRKKNT